MKKRTDEEWERILAEVAAVSKRNHEEEMAALTPPPTGDGEAILPLVIQDLLKRGAVGLSEYGTMLRANNGRRSLVDAYEEALDLCCYLRQEILERHGV